MMTMDEERLLDQAFAEISAQKITPSEGVFDRIMFNADQVLADRAPDVSVTPVPAQGFGAALLDAIGGWMSLGGLTAAAVAGLWIGISPPDVLYNFSADAWGDTIEVPVLESDIFAGLEG